MPIDDSDDKTRAHVALTSGTMISHYRIIEKIGAGGMGEVFLAEDTRLKRNVALKFLPSHLVLHEEIKTRFLREAQAVAKLNHPNIVTIYDVSEFNGRPFFAMEHVEGNLLHHFAHEKPLPLDTVVDYAIQVCQGIGEAHRAGVIHRDIKATNIIVDIKGRARLLDFGLAAVAGDDKLTKTGSTLGTVAYMSPEQVSGRDIDQRSDLFSFGVVLYELLAGRTPFRRDSEGATLRAIMQDTPEPLGRYKSDIPQKLQQILDKLLEKDRQMRYQTAEDIIADLKRLAYDSQQTGSHPPPKAVKSHLKVYVGAAIVVVVVVLAVYLIPRSQSSHSETTNAMPMIAVLPFENLGSPDDEYFADGMTEEITSRLAGIEGLGVISRTSAMQYKKSGKSLSQIGSELGVNYVLEGTIRWAKSGGQTKVRITPQLIRVSDDRHMWADNYERALMEVFAVQAEIASQIVDQLGLTLLEPEREKLADKPTSNERAYEYYLKGISGYRQTDQGFKARTTYAAYFDSAVMLDPEFALAHAERSIAYTWLGYELSSPEKKAVARQAAEKALQLNAKLPQGHRALGTYYNVIETDYNQALAEFEIAKSELPNDPELLAGIAFVQMRQGRFSESQSNYRRAAELDPLEARRHMELAGCLGLTRSFDEVEASINRAIALEPTRSSHYTSRINYYGTRYGDLDKMEQLARQTLKHVDTLSLFSENSWLFFRRLPDLPIDSLFARHLRELRNEAKPQDFHLSVSFMYRLRGDSALSLAHADSARQLLEIAIDDQPDDPHLVSPLGGVLAILGECDRAVEMGHRAMDLLSVDKCHW
ncbi:MAG: protein kinase [bacterium]|nr:protein kinase [bacterium]